MVKQRKEAAKRGGATTDDVTGRQHAMRHGTPGGPDTLPMVAGRSGGGG